MTTVTGVNTNPNASTGTPAPMLQPQQNGMSLKDAISYAKLNPQSEFADKLGGFIQNGDADTRAMQEGIDLSFAGRPGLKDMYASHITMNGGTPPAPESPIEHFTKGYMDLINSAADKTGEQYKEAADKIGSSVTGGAGALQKSEQETPENGSGADAARALLETPLGAASGGAQAIFAPITGIIQALSEKATDSTAMQDFASGNKTTGGILDLHDQLESKLSEIAKAHPEAAKNLGDAANVLLSTLGGETGAGKADLGAAGDTVIEATKNAAQGAKEGIENAVNVAKESVPASEAAPVAQKGVSDVLPSRVTDLATAARGQGATALKSAFSQIYGLPPSDIDFLLEHPEYANHESLSNASIYNLGKEVEGKIGQAHSNVPTPDDVTGEVKNGLQTKMQALNTHARQYATGTNDAKPGDMRKPINVDEDWLRNKLDTAGVAIGEDGRVEFKSDAGKVYPLNPADTSHGGSMIQGLWDEYGPKFESGKMNRPTFLKFRQSLADIANYPGGVDTAVQKVAHGIRDDFNTDYRPQWDGLDKLDAEHAKMQKDLDTSLTGIATIDKSSGMPSIKMNEGAAANMLNAGKDTRGELSRRLENIAPGVTKKISQINDFRDKWGGLVDENGVLQENALSNIKNSVNSGRDLRLGKLEQLMPGITDRIKLIKAAEDYNGTLGLKPGKYATGAAVSQVLTGNPFVGLGAMAATSPAVGLKILRIFGKYAGQ